MMRLLLLLLVMMSPMTSSVSLASLDGASVQAMFDEANALIERADETMLDDPMLSRSLSGQSAALYRACIEQGGIDNANLHSNLGNAEFRAGNIGLAIVSYRRAERLDPTNPVARAGLVAARSRVGALINPDPPTFAVDAVFVWRKWIPRSAVFGAGVIAWLGLWSLLGLRVTGLCRAPAGWMIGLLAVALLTLGGQYAEQRLLYHDDNAVVIALEIVGRNGPNPVAYQPTFADPLVSGVECVLLEERDGWNQVRLKDGRTTWLPADALETI
jgi:hypothetical protein